ncbi:MAG: TetR/AcrR family transcriptional regulator [Solirubrobacteraceae bacterium]|nr:TetR/AcrR family transcriptional regulator [Solirubrobacteraceae bacterium]
MSEPAPRIPTVRRPQRADARRNYDALLSAARDVFATEGAQAPLEEIARRADVGIATLYRNFPTRQDLFDAVYLGEVEELCDTARELAELPPWEAFAAWVDRFAGYIATKMAIKEGLDRDSETVHDCRAAMVAASEPLFRRAQAAGEIRPDAEFDAVLRMLAGITAATYVSDAQRDQVIRMALDGLRTRPPEPSGAAA